MATRKVRAKRFVECFMESFRIVDFLALLYNAVRRSAAWIYDGRRNVRENVRERVSPLLVRARELAHAIPRKYKRILFKFSKSLLFVAVDDNDGAGHENTFRE